MSYIRKPVKFVPPLLVYHDGGLEARCEIINSDRFKKVVHVKASQVTPMLNLLANIRKQR